ncbi:MAG: hypothetical protein Q8Q28_10975 [Pseudomonadota bacterium]|nr:hypothetical protein [Pseudomonadota bacterium]
MDKDSLEFRWRQAKLHAGDFYGPALLLAITASASSTPATAQPPSKVVRPAPAFPVDDELVIDLGSIFEYALYGLLWIVLVVVVYFLWAYLFSFVVVALVLSLFALLVALVFSNPLILIIALLMGDC